MLLRCRRRHLGVLICRSPDCGLSLVAGSDPIMVGQRSVRLQYAVFKSPYALADLANLIVGLK